MRQAAIKLLDELIKALHRILCNKFVFPNLEMLHWERGTKNQAIPQSLFCGFAYSSIQHLNLSHVEIDINFRIDVPSWRLRTLRLGLGGVQCINPLCVTSTVPAYAMILRLCAPTLESSTIYSQLDTDLNTFATEDPIPRFPRLLELRMHWSMKFADWSMLNALIHDGLCTLDMAMESSPVVSAYFQQRGTVPTLTWSSFDITECHSLDFLQANPQLTTLTIRPYSQRSPTELTYFLLCQDRSSS